MGGGDAGDPSGHTPIPLPTLSRHRSLTQWLCVRIPSDPHRHANSLSGTFIVKLPFQQKSPNSKSQHLPSVIITQRKINKYISLCISMQNTISWLSLNLQDNSWFCCMQRQRTSLYIPPLGFVHWLCRCLIIRRQPITSLWCYGEPMGRLLSVLAH